MTTIFEVLEESHERIKDHCRDMTSAKSNPDEKEQAFKDLKVEVKSHASAEERFLYAPVLMFDEGLSKTRHANKEHDEADELMEKLGKIDPKGKAFMDRAKELKKELYHHIDEEENEYFKIARKKLSKGEQEKYADLYLKDYARLKKKFAKDG